MDSETSLASQIMAAIPFKGATWGDLRRDIDVAGWVLEAGLAALKRSRMVVLRDVRGVGVWFRCDAVPDMAKILPRVNPKTRLAKARYDARGWRYCSAAKHYVPVNRFSRGSRQDGLHNHCRECRRDARKRARNA